MDLSLVLVAVDTISSRDAAFTQALAIAQETGAGLYVLHAVPVNERYSFRAADRLDRMAELRARADAAGVRVQTVEQHGDAAEIIELHANARGADLIVIGAEPRSGWGRRSPVAERVIRRTSRPTLVVTGDRPDAPSRFRNVLVAVDLSSASKAVLDAALALMGDAGRLPVMHAVPGVEPAADVQSPARWMVPEYRTHLLDHARRRLETLLAGVPPGVTTRVQATAGPAARTILEQAAEVNADLVIVERRRGFALRGSTAVRLLRRNDRALLVVPGTPGERTARVERPLAA